jgi:hypothetical protein
MKGELINYVFVFMMEPDAEVMVFTKPGLVMADRPDIRFHNEGICKCGGPATDRKIFLCKNELREKKEKRQKNR